MSPLVLATICAHLLANSAQSVSFLPANAYWPKTLFGLSALFGREDLQGELPARGDAELGIDVGEVVFDRLNAYRELPRNLGVGRPGSGETDDRVLCWGEQAGARVARWRSG